MVEKTRRIFFSFHYQRDVWRAQQVRNHWVTKESKTASGFFDGSLEEKAKKEGEVAVKRLINSGLLGASVTCVLIGAETYKRRWVDYEIFKSVEQGMGLFGITIHKLKNSLGQVSGAGENPFRYLGYGTNKYDRKMYPKIHYATGWADAPLNGPITETAAPYLNRDDRPVLSNLFPVYDWILDDGYDNFSTWVSDAAFHANR